MAESWITRDEFHASIERFERALDTGLGRIETQLERMNGSQRAHGEAIAVLEDRSDRVEHGARVGNARWGSIGALIGGGIAALIGYFTGGTK